MKYPKFEKNSPVIALNVLNAKKKKIYPANVSRHNSKLNKIIPLITQNK